MKVRFSLLLLPLALLAACATNMDSAVDSLHAGRYDSAFKQFSELAGQGDAQAEMYLGFLYLEGKGVTQDYAQAMQWFQKARDQGNARAGYYIAWMYWNGAGVKRDYDAATQLYLKAATDGDDYSAAVLGFMYVEGDVVDKDVAKGLDWYRKAAELGNFRSQVFMAGIYLNGYYGVPKDEAQAKHMFALASQQKFADRATGADAMRSIIDAHKTYPADAIKAGAHGVTVVSFDYFDQLPRTVRVDQSSGSASLDAAAVSAVEQSVFPKLSPAIMGTTHYIVALNFDIGQPPVAAPAAATSR